MQHTEKYQLTQWEKSDRIMMDDFNDNNRKIEDALARMEQTTASLAFYIGQLGYIHLLDRTEAISQRCMIWETFLQSDGVTVEGDAKIQSGAVVLTGKNKVSTVKAPALSVDTIQWKNARIWVLTDHGTGTPKINGEETTLVTHRYDTSFPSISAAYCQEFLWTGEGKRSAQISVELSSGSFESAKLFGYFLIVY